MNRVEASPAAPGPARGVSAPLSALYAAKVRPAHHERLAIVDVRQSSPQQVAEHRESADRQYALVGHAVGLG